MIAKDIYRRDMIGYKLCTGYDNTQISKHSHHT